MEKQKTDLKTKRGQIKAKLTRFQTFFMGIDRENLEEGLITELKLRISKIDDCLEEFDKTQSELEMVDPNELESNERQNFETLYFKLLSETKNMCTDFENKITYQLNDYRQSVQGSPANSVNVENVGYTVRMKLPDIKLPNFDGQYKNWLEFRDGFRALVDSNRDLTDSQKFYYLRSALSKEAKSVIKSLETTEKNYSIAWALLEERFENKALTVHNHVKSLFEYPKITHESHKELRDLYDEFKEHLGSLESLGENVKSWDRLVIYLLTTKFDEITRREWESYNYESDLPTMNDMHIFLKNKCAVLEKLTVDKGKDNKWSNKSKNKYSTSSFVAENSGKLQCYFCNQSHMIYTCNKFLALPISKRISELKQRKMCLNCLGSNHMSWTCKAKKCGKCNKAHHLLIHIDNYQGQSGDKSAESKTNVPEPDQTGVQTRAQEVQSAPKNVESLSSVVRNNNKGQDDTVAEGTETLLSTVLVNIICNNGKVVTARSILDSGSQSNFVSEKFANKLDAKMVKTNHIVNGIGQNAVKLHNQINITVSSRINKFQLPVTCLLIPNIAGNLPKVSFDKSVIKIPENCTLADPQFNVSNEIDLLLGSQVFWTVICDGNIRLGPSMPVLQNTQFGWLIAGNVLITNNAVMPKEACTLLCTANSIDNQIAKFWSLEEVSNQNNFLSDADKFCELNFERTTKRDETGRFVVNIPFKESVSRLGDSRHKAMQMFYSLENKLTKNPNLKCEYVQFMDEYEQMGHMSEINIENNNVPEYIIPHHAVIKTSSVTTKCRVVFNASVKTSSGLSLNDTQFIGPSLQNEIFDILLRFRKFKYVMSADVSKMYRQILIENTQRNYQKIFWRANPTESLKCFQLNTVTYGTASAPYLAVRCILKLAHENQNKFPKASQVIANSFYIDDLLTGSDSLDELVELQRDIFNILLSAGFELRKWLVNEPKVLDRFLLHKSLTASTLQIGENENNKTLGIMWQADSDIIQYSVCQFDSNIISITKRKILSIVCQIYDPLGLLGPIIIIAKLLLQSLWKIQSSWDAEVPPDIFSKWLSFQKDLCYINELKIPRHAILTDYVTIELHAFADSSEKAYGACLYLRCERSNGLISSHLLCAKSRVAPIKSVCLPRLELCAAVLLANLTKKTSDCLQISFHHRYFWTDSSITLAWLKGDISKWKTFVANRVSHILSLTDQHEWNHIRSRENPADLLSRGLSAEMLKYSQLWWHGPPWLLFPKSQWNISNVNLNCDPPEQKTISNVLIIVDNINIFHELIHKYSSLNKLLKVTSYMLRFINNCRSTTKISGPLIPGELESALLSLVKVAQIKSFPGEYNDLLQNKPLHAKSKLLPLNPFLHDNVLRVGGRVQKSMGNFDEKHQIILPKDSQLTTLIILHEHKKLFHCGTQNLICSLRQKFWPISARNTCRKVLRTCITCFRNRPKDTNYLMGNLPEYRVNDYAPFLNVGVDYGGPIQIKDRKTRGAKIIKGYLCLFVCMSSKAVHLELVTDLTTEAFLAMLKRFISRRGKPCNIFSDNGLNFVGANNELKRLYDLLSSEQNVIANKLVEDHIKWHFIPAKSPTFGGIWEAGIKSCKFHIKRVMGNASLTYEDFYTLLTEIEGILNSRPLCPLSPDPNDVSALTPGHFLIGRPITALPELNLQHVPENRLNRFQRLQSITQHFWRRWQKEYLHELQTRVKWRRHHTELLKVGSLVLIKKENIPPYRWPLGRVTALFPGDDGITRVVEVKVHEEIVKRAVTNVCALPLEC